MNDETVSPAPQTDTDAAVVVIDMVSEEGLPSQEDIALLAYSYWQARGCEGGSAVEDWLRAEQELLDRLSQKKD
jgi:chitodextrinase